MSNNPVPPAPKPKGRHRAAPPPDDPSNLTFDQILQPTQSIPVVPVSRRERRDLERADASRRKHQRKSTALATGSFAVVAATGGVLGFQTVGLPVSARSSQSQSGAPTSQGLVLAGDAELVFEGPKVSTEAAPPPPPPPPVPVVPVAPVKVEQAAVVAPAPAPPIPAPVTVPAPVPADKGAAVRAAIVEAAKAQVGQTQDCVKMVADALATVNIYWYKWPVEYYQIGRAVSAAEALPGDLIFYQNGMGASVAGMAHIAIYIGNGQAVHGGWNGNQTIIYSVNVGSGPNFIRLNV